MCGQSSRQPSDYSIKELRRLCQAIPEAVVQTRAGKVSRWFSIYLTWCLIRTSATVNQLNFIGTVIYLAGVGLFAFNNHTLSLLGFGLLLLATLVDACDGEVWRFRGYTGGYGASYAEPLTHDIMYGLMFVPIGYGAFLKSGQPLYILFGAAASIFKLLFRFAQVRFFYGVTQKLPTHGHIDATKKLIDHSAATRWLYTAYRNTATSSGLHVFLLAAIVLDRLDVFIAAYAFLFFALWAGLLARQFVRFRKISRQIYADKT